MIPLLIGQAPGPRTDPDVPLSGRCGARLAELCGLSLDEFLASFRRVNLIERFPGKQSKGDRFPIDLARRGAIELLMTGVFTGAKVVLLGDNVARAFGWTPGNFSPLRFYPCGVTHHGIAVCPHPSGVNRWWNNQRNVYRARGFWSLLASEALRA